jgi:response regulator of citrate/malate metabolism
MSPLAQNAADASLYIAKMLEHVTIGWALVGAYDKGTPFLTPQEIAARAGCSDDTARRHLNDLLAIGRVTLRREYTGVRTYCISPVIAAKVIALLSSPEREPA